MVIWKAEGSPRHLVLNVWARQSPPRACTPDTSHLSITQNLVRSVKMPICNKAHTPFRSGLIGPQRPRWAGEDAETYSGHLECLSIGSVGGGVVAPRNPG